jgi:tol-pal system protein YbgF
MKKRYFLMAAMLSSQLVAQPFSPVVELDSSGSSDSKKKPSASDIQRAEQFYQMQVLKDEVKMLRGKVDELSYQLQQIKQLQMDDYLDLDRRLSAITSAKAVTVIMPAILMVPDAQLITSDPEIVEAPKAATPEDIQADYLASSKLLIERDFDGAIAAFKDHILNFPESPYLANAQYWLGEIYEFRGEAELAVKSFETVVNNYSKHNKAMDARYKLGKLYHKQGDTQQAVAMLKQAAQSNGGAGAKAKAYLKDKSL